MSVREVVGWENMYGVSEGRGRGGRICMVSVREGAGLENMYGVSEGGGGVGEYVRCQ